jgi:alcohol dehydrogenase
MVTVTKRNKMTDFSFNVDPEIIIGVDTINRVGTFAAQNGERALIVTEQILYENRRIDRLVSILEDSGVEAIIFDEIPAQATAEIAESAAVLARGARCSMVIGFGGLKTQSIARMCAMLGSSMEKSVFSVFDLLDGQCANDNFLPYIAIPTTGRDPFLFSDSFIAVDPRDRSAKLVKSPRKLCTAAIIDGALSETLSGKFAETTAFDGFCTAIEAYCSTKAQFLSDALLEHAIILYTKMMNSSIEKTNFDPISDSANAGFLMALGSAISAPGIGTALSYSLNARFPVAKSWCSTVLLPYVLEGFAKSRPEKMARVAALMGASAEDSSTANAASMVITNIRRWMGILKVPARLKDFDLSLDRLVPVAQAARNLEFVSFSPQTISSEDAYDMLKQAF